ncbi:MAG TPA: glycosyltransferase family 4 protein [Candidatus Binatia bacterium]|nr:glycosyltransferase family 4 protein [Candidatus Binatia bacterium]
MADAHAVLHVDPERAWGGGEVQVLALARELARRGHRTTIAADPAGELARRAGAAGLAIVPLRVANHLDVRAALALRRLAAGHDVVHFHTARAHALAPVLRGLDARRVVTRRMDYVPAGGAYARFLYNRAVDVVIAISDGVRAALLRAGVRPDRIRVVPSGVDADAFATTDAARSAVRREWMVAADEVAVVVVGALERRKGHAVLLDAAAGLRALAPGLRYVFCGDGSEAAALARAAASLGGIVRFAGFRRDVAACLAAADIVALPSLHEGLGVAALEAMAAGRPVVASRVGGLAEAVEEGEAGLLVPPGDAAALGVALARLAHDPALRARLGAAGRMRVAARYTTTNMANGTLACYDGRP